MLRVWQSEVLAQPINYAADKIDSQAVPGTIVGLEDGIDVCTTDGVLRLLSVQVPGKKAVAALEYINSGGKGRILAGQRLG